MSRALIFFLFLASLAFVPVQAEAGVFDLPYFVQPNEFALGLEPEVIFSNGAGVGANAKFTYGLNDLMNGTAILGTGTGPRRFRVGANVAFDFFPDIDKQPGIGLGLQSLYYRQQNNGRMDLTAIPYIHKAFQATSDESVDPFVSVPFGLAFSGGEYKATTTIAFGAAFKTVEHFRWITEFGIALNNAETYFSGGVVYYP